jgi:hypothetical protein
VTTDADYITLAQAAALAGYASKSSLQTAARRGRLQTRRIGNQLVTTQAWLEQYLAELRRGRYRRGEPRRGRDRDALAD